MITGPRAALGLLPKAAALALAAATALGVPASAASGVRQASAGSSTASAAAGRTRAADGSWTRAWSWRSGSGPLPKGCAAYSGRTSAGMRWSPSLVRIAGGRLRLGTSGGAGSGVLAGSGIGCKGLAQRYGLFEVRARIPTGAGLVGRIALWPSRTSQGSDWSGLTVPSADVGPSYATNGCGDEAYGAAVPGRLAGAFHDFVLAWSPKGFSVAVDGRTLYRDGASFGKARWLGISLSVTGASATTAQLVVEKVTAYSWAGATPAAAGSTNRPAGDPSPGTSADTAAPASSSGSRSGSRNAFGLATGPRGTGAGKRAPATSDGDTALTAALDRNGPGGPWLVAGGLVTLGVLLGIARAARAARRRPLAPR